MRYRCRKPYNYDRLPILSETAAHHHERAQACGRGFLEHAKKAGDALVEAYHITGHRSKWRKWRNRWLKEHNVSLRTVYVYMRVAKKWNDPRIEAARAEGVHIDSIKGFLQVVQNQKAARKWDDQTKPMDKLDFYRTHIRQEFAKLLRKLDLLELIMLSDILSTTPTDLPNEYLEPIYKELQKLVRLRWDENHYPELVKQEEENSLRARRRVLRPRYNSK